MVNLTNWQNGRGKGGRGRRQNVMSLLKTGQTYFKPSFYGSKKSISSDTRRGALEER